MKRSFVIRPLEPDDASTIVAFMKAQQAEHMRYFYAFEADESAIIELLSKAELDIYLGIFWQNEFIGFFMLRGWDAGFEYPSYGVLINEKYLGKTIFDMTIDAAKSICKLSGAKKLMVKMHSSRISPKGAARLGLYVKEFEESTGNIVYYIDL